jgi:hypothetical protein
VTDEQKAAYVQSQAAVTLIEALGMFAENMQRNHQGMSIAYGEDAFRDLILRSGIHHNGVIQLFHGN